MPELWLDADTAALLKDVAASEFLMAKQTDDGGKALSLAFWRDEDNDAGGVTIPAQEVFVRLSGGSGRPGIASRQGTEAIQITVNTGELRKEAPFNVRNGDRFVLPPAHPDLAGVACLVSGPPVDAGAYITAPFRAEG